MSDENVVAVPVVESEKSENAEEKKEKPVATKKLSFMDVLRMKKKTSDLKTAEVVIPSRGLPYQKDLCVPEKIKVREFTTSDRMAQTVEDLIDRCIVIPGRKFKAKDLVSSDQEVLMIEIRKLTLGNVYEQEVSCPTCHSDYVCRWNLDDIKVTSLDANEYPFKITLPETGLDIAIKVLSASDIERISEVQKTRVGPMKSEDQIVDVICSYIWMIDGTIYNDLDMKRRFYEALPVRDSSYIKYVVDNIFFGAELFKTEKCPSCGRENRSFITFSESFLRPRFKLPEGIGAKK